MNASQAKTDIVKRIQRMRPGTFVILSFLAAAIIGGALLALPAASTSDPVAPLDAFFTAVSAVCVTGLVVVDTGTQFTAFGKGVILFLIQLGGLGVMTFSVFLFLFLGKGLGTKGRWIVTETFTAAPIREIRKLLWSIFGVTFALEAIGAVLLFWVWRGEMPLGEALFASVFHAVSSFCNAGFSFFSTSFIAWRDSILLNATVICLIVAGGLGFPVIYEVRTRLRARREGIRAQWSFHTKLVISTTAILLIGGTALICLLEWRGALAGLPLRSRVLASLFQSVTARTAGFNTLDIPALQPATLFIIVMLMFVGASPGSTGGGIKTTSLAVFAAIFFNRFRGRESVSVFKRTVPAETVTRALSIIGLAAVTITTGLVLLLVFHMGASEPGSNEFLVFLFEAVSAFGTVGLSMGATPALSAGGKVVVIVLMLLGRVGLLTVAYVVTRRERYRRFRYAEEKVMIG
ncbi:MAG: TrkH family potassium uptake protein [Candidatus Krumholzibacteria bacterium]|nr:TrkH family potassium uptake protein [Candidatus Krumholzibacteria bacterium]